MGILGLMLVLGIETTCDETSCAVVREGREILSLVTASQIEQHRQFGGVVPELACRRHIDAIVPVLEASLQDASVSLNDIDAIAVARGPGLIGALLIGVQFAKALAWAIGKPVVGVNHIEAHLYAAIMSAPPGAALFPALGLVLSGGHTSLFIIRDIGNYQRLGTTVDDAIGEAFDKCARILGCPYPGGPEIERLAQGGDPKRFALKSGRVKANRLDFSFSGIKTAVLYTVQALEKTAPLTEQDRRDIAASFQKALFDDVIEKTALSLTRFDLSSVFLGGGVTQNRMLRDQFASRIWVASHFAPPELCLDNAAMIAGLGYEELKRGRATKEFEAQAAIDFYSGEYA